MCYRVATPSIKDIVDGTAAKLENPSHYKQYFHVSGFAKPELPTITFENQNIVQLLNWRSRDEFNTLNAKSETLFDKYFKRFVDRRCLILVSGFFEHRDFNKKKYPYFIKPKINNLFAIGGLVSNDGCLSVITTEANDLMSKIHNSASRMPLIIPKENYSKWLKLDLMQEEIKDLMMPYSERDMEAYTVSNHITKKGFDSNIEDILKPFQYPELELI